MKEINVEQILKETSESVTNGKTIKQLEEFKILLKEAPKKDKKNFKYAIRILEEVIRLKKKKDNSPRKKVYISFLLICVVGLLSGIIAMEPPKSEGFDKIFNLSDGHGHFGRLLVGDNISYLDLDDELHVYGDSHLIGDLNVTGNYYGNGSGLTSLTESQIIDLQDYLIEGTPINVTEIYNSVGNLKIMPDVQGDVILFGDTDVGDAISGKKFYVYRRAIEGDDWVGIHISASQKATIYSTANLIIQSDDSKYTQIVSGSHVYFDLSDNNGTNEIRIRDLGNNEVATIDSDGNAWFNGNIGIGVSPTSPISIMGNGGDSEVGITQNQVGGTKTMEFTTSDSEGNQATKLLFRGNNNYSDIEFYTGGRGGEVVTMFIEGSNSFVGIGTITPTQLLDVDGNINISGIYYGDGSQLTGVSTKEFFLPAGSGIPDNNAAYEDEAIILPDAVTFARAYFTFHLPSDFSSMASGYPKIVIMPGIGGGGNVRIQFNTQSGGVGEQLGARIDNIAEYTKAVSSTTNIIIEEDISSAFDGLSLTAGDSVQVYIQRDSDDALDTLAGDLNVVGVIIKYD